MENLYPALVWVESPFETGFGLGGVSPNPPVCQDCLLEMTHVGVFPMGAFEVLQIFYCLICNAQSCTGQILPLKSKKKVSHACIYKITSDKQSGVVKKIKENNQGLIFVDPPPTMILNTQNNTQSDSPSNSSDFIDDIPVHSVFAPFQDVKNNFSVDMAEQPNVFLDLSSKIQNMYRKKPKGYNGHQIGTGVYTQGKSPHPAPRCTLSTPHHSCQLFLHVDSVAHDHLRFENDNNFCVYLCSKHPDFFSIQMEKTS